MKSDTTLSETVSAVYDVVLLVTDVSPLRVRGSFIFLIKSLNTLWISVPSVRWYLHFMIIIYINAQSWFQILQVIDTIIDKVRISS